MHGTNTKKQIMFRPMRVKPTQSKLKCLDSGIRKSYECGKSRICFFVSFRVLFIENGFEILQYKEHMCLSTIIINCSTVIKTLKLLMMVMMSESNYREILRNQTIEKEKESNRNNNSILFIANITVWNSQIVGLCYYLHPNPLFSLQYPFLV